MTGISILLIVVGLFLAGGVFSFVKQGLPRGVVLLLALSSAMCLLAGVLRIQGVWA
ncbi:hypothetical protein [Streptomyces sp. TP-A0874]|uniref:hypothetical protein n=1 Tax=Streptomyces sp. TP-A0874 TaxID=549819 RepID=UPI00147F08AD|nr:hypothetical protein [Streptomyces sp. TP-A0874]